MNLPKEYFNSPNANQDKSGLLPKEGDRARGSGSIEIPPEKILALVAPTSQMIIVEIGIGTGETTLHLARTAQKVIAIDNSEEMLRMAGQNIRKAGLRNVYLKLGEAEKIPLKPKSVNQVLASTILHHTPNPPKAIKEMARALKKGGKIVIIDYEQHGCHWLREQGDDIWLGFLAQDVGGWLEKAGLANVNFSSLGKYYLSCPTGPRLGKINLLAFTASKPTRYR